MWIPAYAGMTKCGVGMAKGAFGMARGWCAPPAPGHPLRSRFARPRPCRRSFWASRRGRLVVVDDVHEVCGALVEPFWGIGEEEFYAEVEEARGVA